MHRSLTLPWISSVFLAIAAIATAQAQDSSVVERVRWQHGPAHVDLAGAAMVQIPAGYVAADGSDTRLLMEGMGNPPSHDEVGLIAPDGLDWFVVFEFSNTGYVKDDEKSSLDADAILASLVKANNQANEARKKMGFGPLTILGWEQQPHYDILTNNLTWAIRGREDGGSLVINHNTRLLGRSGVMRVTLVGSPDVLPRIMRDYRARLGTFTFNAGHRYSEFR